MPGPGLAGASTTRAPSTSPPSVSSGWATTAVERAVRSTRRPALIDSRAVSGTDLVGVGLPDRVVVVVTRQQGRVVVEQGQPRGAGQLT